MYQNFLTFDDFDPVMGGFFPYGMRKREPSDFDYSVGNSRSAKLAYMHYTNPYWNQERTLFGAPKSGLHYDYSDRLQSWDHRMYSVGQAVAKADKHEFSANWWQSHLEAYTLREVTIVHIKGGCNRATGYEYYVIGYELGAPLSAEKLSRIRHIAGRRRFESGKMRRHLPTKLQAQTQANRKATK